MIIVEDKVIIEIRIEGRKIPTSANLVSEIALVEGYKQLFPCGAITFNDLSGSLSEELNLVDGNHITITMGKDHESHSTVTRQYRLFGASKRITAAGPQIRAILIYDAPNFITASVSESFEASSADVLAEIAEICKLQFDGPDMDTHDKQVWLNISKNRASFVHEVTRHGYIDENSAMYSVLTSMGVLKYKNLMDLIEKEPKYHLYHNISIPEDADKSKSYVVKQAKNMSSSGLLNSWQNYGSTRVVHSLSGEHTLESSVDVKTTSKYLPINKQVADTVKRARVEYSSLDCGNVSDKYERALYQNLKLLALFTERLPVLIMECTDIQLLDVISYKQANSDISESAESSDVYLVTGKTAYSRGGMVYAERLEIARMSITKKGATHLTTSDPASLKDLAVPESFVNINNNVAAAVNSIVNTVTTLFSVMNNPSQLISFGLNQLGPQLQYGYPTLSSLVNQIAVTGIPANPQATIDALRTLVGPSTQLVDTLTAHKTNLTSISNSLTSVLSQVNALDPQVQTSVRNSNILVNSLFNPSGVVLSLSQTLPVLKNISDLTNVYTVVNQIIQMHTAGLTGLDPTISSKITDFGTNTQALQSNYTTLSNTFNSLWNKCISVTNKVDVPSTYNNVAAHEKILRDLAITSLQVPEGGYSKVVPTSDINNSIARLLQRTDFQGNLLWLDPNSSFNKLVQLQPNQLQATLDQAKLDSSQLMLIPGA
jgi:hypothetical protein